MGAETALYSATCQVIGKYGNGNVYPLDLSAVVGLSGWLPCSRLVLQPYNILTLCGLPNHSAATAISFRTLAIKMNV